MAKFPSYRIGNSFTGGWGVAGPALTKPKPPAKKPAAYDPYKQATSGVNAIIASLLASVQQQQDAARKQAETEAAREMEKGRALAFGLQQLGIAPAVQNIFQSAGQNQAGLAQGFSGQIRDQASAQAADQIRQLSGTGQEGAVRNEGNAMGNVTYGTGGFIPGTELNTLGAAYGAQAALQPGFAEQFGNIASATRTRDYTEKELPKFLQERLDVIAKTPALLQDLLKDERAWAQNLFDRDIATAKLKASASNEAWDRGMDVKKLDLATGKETWNQKLDVAKLGLSQQTLDLRAEQMAASNSQAWARIGIMDKNSQISAANLELAWQKYKNPNTAKSASTARIVRKDAGKIASQAWNGVKTSQVNPLEGQPGYNPDYKPGARIPGTSRMSYQEAMREGLAQGIPLSVMQTALNTYWKRPGMSAPWETPGSVEGRPKVPYQFRVPKKDATNTSDPVVKDALQFGPQLGVKYVFGGASPEQGFDCSGYTKFLLERRGVSLPHNAAAQFNDPRGKEVPTPALRAGDLVFFKSSPNSGSSQPPWHTGYYIGGGKYVEYYSSGKPARVSSLSSRKDYMGARRFV